MLIIIIVTIILTIQLLRRLVLACVKIDTYTMVTTSVVIRIVLVQVTHTHRYINK